MHLGRRPLSAERVRLTQSSRCSSKAADEGDVVRPSAQASAPVSPPAVAEPHAGAGANSNPASSQRSSNNSSSTSGGNNSSKGSSYSEFYKVVNSRQYGLSSAAGGHFASPGGPSLDTSTTSSSGSDSSTHQQPHQEQSHQQPGAEVSQAAAAGGDGHSVTQGGEAQLQGHLPQQLPGSPDPAGVEDAIRKAQEALAAAETSLSSIHKLRSAQPPSNWTSLLQVLNSLATAAAAGALLVASHAFGLGWQWAGATIGALALAAAAFKQQNVTEAGAVAAASACLATFGCSLRFGLVLLAVSYSSCKLRQFKEARAVQDFSTVSTPMAAQQQQQQQEQQQPRDWLEVAGVAAIPTILAIAYGAMAGCLDLPLGSLPAVETWRADLLTLLQGAVLGWYACICGDAWSGELGELSGDQPRLLTTMQPVRKGTHGGVTLLGLTGAAAGGLLVGAVFYCAAVLSPTLWVFDAQRMAAMAQWRVIPLGLMAGLFGSLLDSLLGAALQFTGYDLASSSLTSKPGPSVQRISGLQLPWLTDNVVNVLAASVTAVLTALAALATFG